MAQEDVLAILSYLRTLELIENDVPDHQRIKGGRVND
jgi:hypothetical protein